MRRRLGFIRHCLSAIVWMVAIVCCLEVGARILLVSATPSPRPLDEIPTIPCGRLHHQLEPLGTLSLLGADGTELVETRLNSLGLRGPEPQIPKPEQVLRVLCLGDELTFGPGLRDEELFSAKLQEHLTRMLPRPVEVINAGVPGYCPLLSFLQFRHQLQSLDPDVIVLTFDMNDVADDYDCRSFVRLDPEGMPLVCRNPALDAPTRARCIEEQFVALQWMKSELEAWNSGNTAERLDDINHPAGTYAWIRETPPDWNTYLQNALEPVQQLHTLTADRRPLILFAVCPAPWQVSAEATPDPEVRRRLGIPPGARYENRGPFQTLSRLAQSAQWNFLDVSLAFGQAGNPEGLYLEHAPWFSDRGHELYAGILAHWLLPRLSAGAPPRSIEPPRFPLADDPGRRRL